MSPKAQNYFPQMHFGKFLHLHFQLISLLPVLIGHVLFFYCFVKHCYKCSSLKLYPSIISQFCKSEICLDVTGFSYQSLTPQDLLGLSCHREALGEESSSKSIQCGSTWFPVAVGRRSLFPRWLSSMLQEQRHSSPVSSAFNLDIWLFGIM